MELDKEIKPDIIHLLTGDFALAPFFISHKVTDNGITLYMIYIHMK